VPLALGWTIAVAPLFGQEYTPSVSETISINETGSVPFLSPPADFNGDGAVDFVAHRSLYLGLGDGTFVPTTISRLPLAAQDVGDVNGDDVPDILAVHPWFTATSVGGTLERTLQVGINTQADSFEFLEVDLCGDFEAVPLSGSLSDLDLDGNLDVVALLWPQGETPDVGSIPLMLTFGDGLGQFGDCRFIPSTDPNGEGEILARAVVADVNNDGYPDIVGAIASDTFTGWVSVVLNEGNRHFGQPHSYVTLPPDSRAPDGLLEFWEPRPKDVTPVDVDHDGDVDFVVGHFGAFAFSFLRNRGDGSFDLGVPIRTPELKPVAALAQDLNQDGMTDVVAADGPRVDLYFWSLETPNILRKPVFDTLARDEQVRQVRVADFNDDGSPDIVVNTSRCELLSLPCRIVVLLGGQGERFVRGDADADGGLTLTDALRILAYLFLGGEGDVCADRADTNDSGTVEISDAIYLLNYLFLGGPRVPPPFSEPGFDTTLDALDCKAR
jgi:hypothetical protein